MPIEFCIETQAMEKGKLWEPIADVRSQGRDGSPEPPAAIGSTRESFRSQSPCLRTAEKIGVVWRGSSFLWKDAVLHIGYDAVSAMFSELDADLKAPKQRMADSNIRLNPVPAGNTLLTIIFFSVLAAALLYWLLAPPAPEQASESSATANAQTAERK
jgi:hypothetical protein